MSDSLLVSDFNRRNILVIGDIQFNEAPFKERRLQIIRTTVEDASAHYRFGKAILVTAATSKKKLIKDCFEKLFPEAENYGITHRILIQNDHDYAAIKEIETTARLDKFHLYENIIDLAETIARYSPGPPDLGVKIEGE